MAPRFETNIPERDGFRGAYGTARLGWTPIEGTRFEGLLRWRENKFGLDSMPQDDPNYSGWDRRWAGQIRGETKLLDGGWTTGLRVFSTEQSRRYTNLPDQFDACTREDSASAAPAPAWIGATRCGCLGRGRHRWRARLRRDPCAGGGADDAVLPLRFRRLHQQPPGSAAAQHRPAGPPCSTGCWSGSTCRASSARQPDGGRAARPPGARRRPGAAGGELPPAAHGRHRLPRAPRCSSASASAASTASRFHRQSGPEAGTQRRLGGRQRHRPAWLRQPALRHRELDLFQSRVRDQIVNVFGRPAARYANIDRANIHGAELRHDGCARPTGSRRRRPGPSPRPSTHDDRPPPAAPAGDGGEPDRRGSRRSRAGGGADGAVHRPQPRGRLRQLCQRRHSYTYARSNPAGTVVNLTASWQAFERRRCSSKPATSATAGGSRQMAS